MYIMTVMRTSFMFCVPLFIMLTGYLMNKKTLSKKYYSGIIKTLGIYVLASIACILYKNIFLEMNYSILDIIKQILNFSAANYAWYIEMYIGLFLLIPFLNILYNNLNCKQHKKALIATLLFLTSIPAIINIYNFDSIEWWKNPTTSSDFVKLVPNWWTAIYPLTYYFIGCYLKEFNIKMKKSLNLFLIFIVVILAGTFNYYRSYGHTFISGPYQDWGSILNVILTTLVFVFLSNIKVKDTHITFKKILAKISDLCLGGYLVSYIFDNYFYEKLNNYVPEMPDRLNYFIIIVPIVFVCSILLSYLLNLIYSGLNWVVSKVKFEIYNKFMNKK